MSTKLKASDGKLSLKEIFCYGASGFGQNLICGLISTYIMIFYTDVFGIPAIAAAVIMFAARIFDAFNDPIMGSIVDRTRTRWGKLRPYMLFTPLPIAILTVMCFSSPELSTNGKIAYAAVTYVIWGVLFTIIDVPYWGLSSAMTGDTNERNKLLAFARLACTGGAGLLTLVIPLITSNVTKGVEEQFVAKYGEVLNAAAKAEYAVAVQEALQPTYFWISVACAVVGAPMFLLAFFGTKERVVYNGENPPSLKHNLSLLFKNKPLLLIVLSCVLGSLQIVYTYMFLYLAKYNLGNESYASIMSILVVPLGLVATLTMPFFSKRMGKKTLYMWIHVLQAVVLVAMYFVGYNTKTKLIILAIGLIILGLPAGFNNILTYALIGDTVDYLELKTGERGEGICFAMQTFTSKMAMAFSSLAIGITLGAIFYVPNDFQPSQTVLDGLFFLATMGAAISSALCLIPMFFFKFTEKEQKKAREIIESRK